MKRYKPLFSESNNIHVISAPYEIQATEYRIQGKWYPLDGVHGHDGIGGPPEVHAIQMVTPSILKKSHPCNIFLKQQNDDGSIDLRVEWINDSGTPLSVEMNFVSAKAAIEDGWTF